MNEGGLDLFAGNKPYSHLTMRIDVTFVRPSRGRNIDDVFFLSFCNLQVDPWVIVMSAF